MDPAYILVVALLKTESSYKDEIERPADGVPDTIQFWFTPTSDWRIRTYAIDHDIHVYRLGPGNEGQRFDREYAIPHIEKHYSDVIDSIKKLTFNAPLNKEEIEQTLSAAGLKGILEHGKGEIGFYNPDSGHYRSQSNPQ